MSQLLMQFSAAPSRRVLVVVLPLAVLFLLEALVIAALTMAMVPSISIGGWW